MNKPKFTQGPWLAEIVQHSIGDTGDYYTEYALVVEKNNKNRCIANVFTIDYDEDEAEANLRLIAVASEMYDELVAMRKAIECAEFRTDCERIDNLLKKARGEE